MFTGLRRCAVGAVIVVAASAVGALVAGSAAMAEPADGSIADFLTVASSPAGSLDNLAPGDTASWFVSARNSAAVEAVLSLRVQSDSTSALLTDPAQGLRLQLSACSAAWAGVDASARCPGVQTPIAHGPLTLVLGGYRLPALGAGSTGYYLARVTVPKQATNDVAGQAADLRFEITAVRDEGIAPASSDGETPPAQEVPALNAAPVQTDRGPGADPARRPAALAGTGPGHASVAQSLALALLAAGSLVLVLRRFRID
jgi:hypothetical protein